MAPITLDSCRQVLLKDETTDLMLWPVLRLATVEFLQSVHHVFFFNQGASALLLTNDDKVYALGDNKMADGCLGVGSDDYLVTEPTEVRELHGKTLVQCASGDGFVQVLTSEGDLYGWGSNNYGQVGCGGFEPSFYQPVLVMQHISMVACEKWNTVALDKDGTVWCWGRQYRFSFGLYYIERAEVVEALRGKRVVHIVCSHCVTVALTDQNELYHWGTFGYSHHVGIRINQPHVIASPRLVPWFFGSTPIAFIACDNSSNVFLINCDGQVYRCFYDDFADEHNSDKVPYNFYCQLVELSGPVQAVVRGGSNLCFKLESGQVVIFDEGQVKETGLTSMTDACALYTSQQVMQGMTIFPSSLITRSLMQSIGKFNSLIDLDLRLYFDKNPENCSPRLFLNKDLAVKSSTYLAAKIQDSWSGKSKVEITDCPFVVYFTFVRFVLTGTTGVIQLWWVDQLLELSIESNTVRLQDFCFHYITSHMNDRYFTKIEQLIRCEHWQLMWRRVAIQSLSTTHQALSDLRALSGESCPSETCSLPESYMQWMTDHSNHISLVTLLQDPEQGQFFSRYLKNTVTIDNCFRYFCVAVDAHNETLQEQVACTVANFDHTDHLISLMISDGIRHVSVNQIKALFTRVSKLKRLKIMHPL